MTKRVVVIGVVLVLLGLLVFGGTAVSYVRTTAGYVSDAVGEAIPVDFEIQRARQLIADLTPEVRKNMHMIAKEEVRVRALEEQITGADQRLVKDKEQILRLRSDLQSANQIYEYAGRTYTAEEVRNDLANRFARYRTNEATLESWRKMHEARKRSLEAARQKLEGMLASKRQLEVEVENLEAKMQMIAAAKATSDYQFDDSRLGRVKELVCDLRTRLDVADNLVSAESRFHDEIPLEQTSPEDVVDQVSKYFAETKEVPGAGAVAVH